MVTKEMRPFRSLWNELRIQLQGVISCENLQVLFQLPAKATIFQGICQPTTRHGGVLEPSHFCLTWDSSKKEFLLQSSPLGWLILCQLCIKVRILSWSYHASFNLSQAFFSNTSLALLISPRHLLPKGANRPNYLLLIQQCHSSKIQI